MCFYSFTFFLFNMITNYSNKNYNIKNLISFSMFIFGIIFIFLYNFLDYSNLKIEFYKFDFFKDLWFYFAIIVSFANQIFIRKINKKNENNLVFIKYIDVFTLSLIPLVSYCFLYLGFQDSIKVNYKSIFELLTYSLILMIIAIAFLFDKIKNKSFNKPILILVIAITSTLSNVITVKMMQIYNAEAYYLCIMLVFCLFWFILALKNKELTFVKSENFYYFIGFGLAYILLVNVNIYMNKNFAVEQITVIRIAISIIVAAILDFIRNNKNKLNIKDSILIIILFIAMYYFTIM